MPRRILLLIALTVLGLLAITVAPWTLSDGGFANSIAAQLRRGYGIDLEVRGRSTVALLPVPRIKFEDVTLGTSDGLVTAQGGTLRGELSLWSLLRGRIEFARASLAESRIRIADGALASRDWTRALATFGTEAAKDAHLRRIILTDSSIQWAAGPAGSADRVMVVVNWPAPDEPIVLVAGARWRGERLEITKAAIDPSLVAAGKASPFELTVTAAGGRLSASGEAQLGPNPSLSGQGTVDAKSVRDFSRWSGFDLPFGSTMQAVSIDGEFAADRRRITWPSVAVKLGADRLEGTLAVRFDGNRPAVTGTLAADQLNLSDFFAPFAQARTASGLWSGDDVSVLGATGGDLDLRLSATTARLGRLRVGDMAASVLVRAGRIEASLARASLRKGSLKGRIALTATRGGTEVKAQGAFDQVDLAAVLADLGHPRWIAGQAAGQFVLEGAGQTVADMVRQSHGQSTITIKDGDLIGIGLDDVLRRVEKQPLAASLDWRGGRTAFDQVAVNLNVGAGIGEITTGTLLTPTIRTALDGRVSLIDRSLAVRAHVSPAVAPVGTPPVIEFDLTGGWDDVAVIPDAKALIERSGAARRLLGLDRLPPTARDATAGPPLSAAQ